MEQCLLDSKEAITQFVIRIVILSIGLCSTLFVAISCLLSKRRKYWTFKLLIIQSSAETLDLIGAITMSNLSICYPQVCRIVGYLMHCCWLTSFLCLFVLFYMYSAAINIDQLYNQLINRLRKIIVLCIIFPYIWLFYPFYDEAIGPTGWYLYPTKCFFFIFCGFTNRTTIYTVFWLLPLIIIFGLVLYLKFKIAKQLKIIRENGVESDDLKFVRNITNFSYVYVVFWSLNVIIKYVFSFYEDQILKNVYLYYLLIAMFLLFELHLFVIAILFYINYRNILNFRALWCPKRKNTKTSQSLCNEDNFINESNS